MKVLYLLGWSLLFMAPPASAQEASSLHTGPGDEVVAACGEALGGLETIEAFRTLTFDYPTRAGGHPVKWEIIRPNRVLRERESAFALLFDGARAGFLGGVEKEDGTTSEARLLPEEQWGVMELDMAPYFPAFFHLPWEDLGLTMLGETRVHLIKVVFPLGGIAIYNIDADSFLPLRVDFPEHDYSMDLGDFRPVGGVLIPHRFNPASDSTRVTVIENVRVNVEIDPSRFVFPSEIG